MLQKPTDRECLLVLEVFASKGGGLSWPSEIVNRTRGKMTGELAKRTIDLLAAEGYIEPTRPDRRVTQYHKITREGLEELRRLREELGDDD